MARFTFVPEEVLSKIKAMYNQGYSYETIRRETGVSINIIRNRLGKTPTPPSSGKKTGGRPHSRAIVIPIIRKVNKYDHLFEEPKCRGMMYEDYLRKNKISIYILKDDNL